ncbi:MAG: TlpA disulfide reductase family protein [Calditrichota bacterium]
MERKPLLISAFLIALIIIGVSFYSGEKSEANGIATMSEASMIGTASETTTEDGYTGTTLVLKNLAGEDVAFKDYEGKVVLVNIWAWWCPPCIKEIPDLIKLRSDYKDQEFEIIGVAISDRGQGDRVDKMVEQFSINYPVVRGDAKIDQIMRDFGQIASIPRSFVLNGKGEVVEDITGMRDYAFFEGAIKKHLKPKS